jgi:hypothetical protein
VKALDCCLDIWLTSLLVIGQLFRYMVDKSIGYRAAL